MLDGQMIDLTADDHPFYFNPYSGELSLKFPKAERSCRGGILALVYLSFQNDVYSDSFLVTVRKFPL